MTRATAALLVFVLCASCGADAETAAGWRMRLDSASAADPARLVERDDGLEVKPGPNATLWRGELKASGRYKLSAKVTHLDSGLHGHAHGAGLVFGGTDVHGADQAYTYFLVRGDGHFLIKTRSGSETADVLGWTLHEAVGVDDDLGIAENQLRVEVGDTEALFFVNGAEVHRCPKASLRVDGQCGFRLVHDLHVSFSPLQIETLEG